MRIYMKILPSPSGEGGPLKTVDEGRTETGLIKLPFSGNSSIVKNQRWQSGKASVFAISVFIFHVGQDYCVAGFAAGKLYLRGFYGSRRDGMTLHTAMKSFHQIGFGVIHRVEK